MFRRILREIYTDTPQRNLQKLFRRAASREPRQAAETPQNKVLDGILKSRALPGLLAFAVRRLPEHRILFVGDPAIHAGAIAQLANDKHTVTFPFKWGDDPVTFPDDVGRIVLTLLPATESEWLQTQQLRNRFGPRLILLFELLLPFTQLSHLHQKENFLVKSFDDLLDYYLGLKPSPGITELREAVALAGKKVVEFGPFEGRQTAGLVHSGVSRLTCIEARPENAIKVETIARVFGWSNVHVRMDDFHNASDITYGRFDLVVAHGVYYHSIAPFLFLENLRTLADTIFLGGFCATDELPASPYLELSHAGKSYRAKKYREASNQTAGVNPYAYYFVSDDLIRFFTERGDKVVVLADEPSTHYAGKYLRLLITRTRT